MKRITEIAVNPACLDNKVAKEIHPDDQMHGSTLERYFHVGRDGIRNICSVMILNGAEEPQNILDFACGHGRIARYLAAAFPGAKITGSDLMPSAISFVEETFGFKPHTSSYDLKTLNFDTKFDLIWSGSLMTHLRQDSARDMIELFGRSLSENGLAIFTIHGRHVADKWKTGKWPYRLQKETLIELGKLYHRGEYAYSDYDHMKGYGISITPLGWLMSVLQDHPELMLVSLAERGWDNHQDVVAIAKRDVHV